MQICKLIVWFVSSFPQHQNGLLLVLGGHIQDWLLRRQPGACTVLGMRHSPSVHRHCHPRPGLLLLQKQDPPESYQDRCDGERSYIVMVESLPPKKNV